MPTRGKSLTQLANTSMNVVIPKKVPDVVKIGRFTIVTEPDSPKQKSTAKKGGVDTPSPFANQGEGLLSPTTGNVPKVKDDIRKNTAAHLAAQKPESPIKPKNLFGSPSQNGGTFPYEGGSYVVHKGPRGGQFIRVKNKKIYLPKKRA